MDGRVVVVTDTKRGHENQSRVIARMLGDTDPLVMQLREPVKNGGVNELLLRLKLRFGASLSMNRSQATQLVQRFLIPEQTQAFRDFALHVKENKEMPVHVVSSGTPPATFNLIMARMLDCKTIVNMSPSLLPHSLFDAVVLPEHDLHGRDPEPNEVVSPLALGYHDGPSALHLAQQIRRDSEPGDGELWGVAIGGASKACRWEGDVILDELAQLYGLAKGEGAKLLVTTSRRTPDWCLAWLDKRYRGSEHVPYFLDASQDPLNPLPAFYELCSRMFVTGDSFSMVSEAVHAGHLPLVLKVQPALPENKLGRALTVLADNGLTTIPATIDEELPDRVARSQNERQPVNTHYQELRTKLTNLLSSR